MSDKQEISDASQGDGAAAVPPVAGGANGAGATPAPTPLDPQRTYEALGRFIERRSPYEGVILPDFGPGNLAGDVDAMAFEDDDPTGIPPMTLADKHVLVEKGRYKDFNQGNISNLKAEQLEKETPGYFPKYDLGDGIGRNVVKEVQIHYKHKRKIDKQDCYVSVVVLYLGDAH
jgi:hypothetical protein